MVQYFDSIRQGCAIVTTTVIAAAFQLIIPILQLHITLIKQFPVFQDFYNKPAT